MLTVDVVGEVVPILAIDAVYWIFIGWAYRRTPPGFHLGVMLSVQIIMTSLMLVVLLVGGLSTAAAIHSGTVGMLTWLWWRNRPPRQRKPSRLTGIVKDLGHRLAVVPA